MSLSPLAVHIVLFAGGLTAVVCALRWTRQSDQKIATTEFSLFLIMLGLWNVVQLVELLGGPAVAYYASFGIRGIRGLMALSWFYFTMTYAGYGDTVHSTPVRVAAVAGTGYLVVVTSVPSVATALTFPDVTVISEPFVTVSLGGMTPFRRLSQSIGYSLVAIGTIGLSYRFLSTGYTGVWRIVVFSTTVFSIVGLDFVLDQTPLLVPGVDYSAIGTSVAALVLIFVLYRHDLFGSVPVGRDHVFHMIEDPVFVVNSKRNLLDYNEAARSVNGGDLRVGHEIPEDIADVIGAGPGQRPATEERTTISLPVDGTTKYYEPIVSGLAPVKDQLGTVLLLRDVTAQKQRERTLQRKNERLNEFADIVSHDLRNPLNVASGRLDLARTECESDHLDEIARAHEQMDTLIDDMLALARAGQQVRTFEPVALATSIEQSWRTVETNDATLTVEVERTVRADPARLQQLFENLFRNAVEHAGDGAEITVGTLESGFYVADDGPGIPATDRERVFDSGYTTAADGSGFGLNIVREIVDAHDWKISVGTSDDGGAKFEITNVEFVES